MWAPATAAIPLLHHAGALSFGLLLALAFVNGIPWAAHYGAQSALVPELIGSGAARVAKANAVFQTASRTTYLAGPAIGGALLAVIGAPAVLLVDAATFAVSFAIVIAFVPATAAPAAGGEPAALGRGLALLRADPVCGRSRPRSSSARRRSWRCTRRCPCSRSPPTTGTRRWPARCSACGAAGRWPAA